MYTAGILLENSTSSESSRLHGGCCRCTECGRIIWGSIGDGKETIMPSRDDAPLIRPQRKSAVSSFPFLNARSEGLSSLSFCVFESAPHSSKSFTVSRWPLHAAECNGVQPLLVRGSTCAPR